MILTKVVLNKYRRGARMFLANPNLLHGAIEAAFPSSQEFDREFGRPLYRIEQPAQGDAILYISSPVYPDVQHIVEQAGRENDVNGVLSKPYSNFLENIQDGESYRFRARLNPTKRINGSDVPLIRDERFVWLRKKGELHGFSFSDDSVTITESDVLSFYKGKPGNGKRRKVTIQSELFEGVITVDNAELLVDAIRNGIGRQKAHGFGLVSLGRL